MVCCINCLPNCVSYNLTASPTCCKSSKYTSLGVKKNCKQNCANKYSQQQREAPATTFGVIYCSLNSGWMVAYSQYLTPNNTNNRSTNQPTAPTITTSTCPTHRQKPPPTLLTTRFNSSLEGSLYDDSFIEQI